MCLVFQNTCGNRANSNHKTSSTNKYSSATALWWRSAESPECPVVVSSVVSLLWQLQGLLQRDSFCHVSCKYSIVMAAAAVLE